MQTVEARVHALVAEKFLKLSVEEITSDTHLVNDLDALFIERLNLIFYVQDIFSIDVDEKDFNDLLTVGQIVAYVEKKLKPN